MATASCPAFVEGCPYATEAEVLAHNYNYDEKLTPYQRRVAHCSVPSLRLLLPSLRSNLPLCTVGQTKTWTEENKAAALGKCDAFKDGACPFKGAESLDEIKKVMAAMPESHSVAGGESHGALVHLFGALHASSANVKKTVGECPIFSASGCPFRGAACSNGVPLVDAIEYRRFGCTDPRLPH